MESVLSTLRSLSSTCKLKSPDKGLYALSHLADSVEVFLEIHVCTKQELTWQRLKYPSPLEALDLILDLLPDKKGVACPGGGWGLEAVRKVEERSGAKSVPFCLERMEGGWVGSRFPTSPVPLAFSY